MTSSRIVSDEDLGQFKANEPWMLLDQATAAVRNACGWHVTPVETETVALDVTGARSLLLPTLHIVSVESVTIDGTVLDPGSYFWSTAGVLTGECLRRGRTVVVKFTHGFEDAEDIKGVILSVVSAAQSAPRGVTSQQTGPFAVQYSVRESLEGPEHKPVLDRYRLPPRP